MMDIWLQRLRALKGVPPFIPPSGGKGKRVLFWRGANVPSSLAMDILFALGLAARGARPLFAICDGASPACNVRSLSDAIPLERWSERCPGCRDTMRAMLDQAGLDHTEAGACLDPDQLLQLGNMVRDIPSPSLPGFMHGAAQVGYHAKASLIRYLRGVPIREHAGSQALLRAYACSALIHADQAALLARTFQPDFVVMQHGIYADWGPALDVFHDHGVDVILWRRGMLPDHFMFRLTPPGHALHVNHLQPGVWERISQEHMDQTQELEDFLRGESQHNSRFNEQEMEPEALRARLKLENSRPVWCLFSHVGWDGASFEPEEELFEDQLEWLVQSCKIMASTTDIQWLVKIHPGEQLRGNMCSLMDTLRSQGPLPGNVVFIPAESGLNTYGLYTILDGAVTMCGTPGLEMALMGKPVILARSAHYGGKGFTYEPSTRQEYSDLLSRARELPTLSPPEIKAARRYAHHYFLERQMKLPLVREHGGGFQFQDFSELQPGCSPPLDAICDDLLSGGPFVRR